MKPLVYLAGPYSKPDPAENVHRAVLLFDKLLSEGRVTPLLPHTSHLIHLIKPRPYQDWIAYDLELLPRCDALLRFGGDSDGAQGEMIAAVRLRIPVFPTVADLYVWVDSR